ncbi:alpha/beta fold hydrolase [Paenibacillus chartarius]|uniref:Alpha/beta fold hydrolase n=1 Tax=Paenibacillus chartarius TaxID=747481 RepID=A0ABV6DNG9_9BACL
MESISNGIYYREQGEGEPLVLLHGFPLDGTMWDEQLAFFSDKYRVITPDLRGCGLSEATETTSMDQMADDVASLLHRLGLRKAIVAGFSMGGYVLFALLRRHPELVSGVILTNTKAEADTEEGKAGRAKMAQSIREQGAAAAASAMLPKLLSPAASEEQRNRLQRMMLTQKPQGLIAAVLAMADRPDSTAQLGSIRVPTLVIGAEGDTIMPFSGAEAMAAAIPGAVLRRIEGAGHAANVERPELWNAAVREWLDAAF